MQTISSRKQRSEKMKVVLCNDGVCVPPKCPTVAFTRDAVIIGEADNSCRLTKEQFAIMKDKIKKGEI